MMKKGIDIYKHNPINDMAKVAESIDFIILQIGYGVQYTLNQKDTKFDERYAYFHGKIPIGVYYYAYGKNIGDGKKEAENCLKYLEGRELELPIYYDIEDSSNRNHDAITMEFVDTIKAAGYRAGVYTYTSYAKSNMHLDKFSDCSLWIAAYGKNDGQILDKYKPSGADIWQYTSNGTVAGMPNRVDMNVMLNDSVIEGNDEEMSYDQFKEYMTQYNAEVAKKGTADDFQKMVKDFAIRIGITADGANPQSPAKRWQIWTMFYRFAQWLGVGDVEDDGK